MIKYLFSFLLSLLFLNTTQAQNFQFDKTTYNFGTITQGETVQVTFSFTNTTQRDMIVGQVHTSCGCTLTEWTEEIIPPQESGFLTVTFDTKEHPGSQTKVIILIYNYIDGDLNNSREQKLTLNGYVTRN